MRNCQKPRTLSIGGFANLNMVSCLNVNIIADLHIVRIGENEHAILEKVENKNEAEKCSTYSISLKSLPFLVRFCISRTRSAVKKSVKNCGNDSNFGVFFFNFIKLHIHSHRFISPTVYQTIGDN